MVFFPKNQLILQRKFFRCGCITKKKSVGPELAQNRTDILTNQGGGLKFTYQNGGSYNEVP